MALKNKILFALSLTTVMGMASAKAYIVPGERRPDMGPQGDYRPQPPQQPWQPVPPAPVPQPRPQPQPEPQPFPQPGNGGYNPYPGNGGGYGPGNGGGYNNGQEQRVVQVRRRIMSENLPLLQLAGIDRRYDGYTVQSITVYAGGSAPRSEVALIINGQRDASAISPRGPVTLTPFYRAVLGQVRDIQLAVNGGVDVDSVVITLQAREGGGGGGGWGPREITVPLAVSRRMLGNDRLELTQYIDLNQYRGMRLTAIEVEANALYQVAMIDLLVNNYAQGPSLQVGNFGQRYVMATPDIVLGQGPLSIALGTRGDLDIRGVTLRLSRR